MKLNKLCGDFVLNDYYKLKQSHGIFSKVFNIGGLLDCKSLETSLCQKVSAC
jgi:hypothetical protein